VRELQNRLSAKSRLDELFRDHVRRVATRNRRIFREERSPGLIWKSVH
jgi:hypothetical protein